mgnify:CR=1 FL=1
MVMKQSGVLRFKIEHADEIITIRDGEVFRAGTPLALAHDPEVRRVYLGDDFDLLPPENRS